MATPDTKEATVSTAQKIVVMSSAPDTPTNLEFGNVSRSTGSLLSSKAIDLGDCPVEKKHEWGPSISDMTLSVGGTDMPVIRFDNYMNMAQMLPVNGIMLQTGNEAKGGSRLSTMSLDTFLFNRNLLCPVKQAEYAVVTSQACLVPFADEAPHLDIRCFNPYNFHYSNPKVLVIVIAPNGTSTQVVVGNEQTLRFNNFGRKGQFSNVFANVEGANYNIEHDLNRLTIVQVPLRVSRNSPNQLPPNMSPNALNDAPASSASSWTDYLSLSNLWRSSEAGGTDGSKSAGEKGKDTKPVQYIRHVPSVTPLCKCGKELVQLVAQFCYGVNEDSVTVSCDTCAEPHSGNDIMWHCPSHKSKVHPDGFDVCNKCALAQCNFDLLMEGTGYDIVREVNVPVRVTHQYYFPISKGNPGRISGQLAQTILTKLISAASPATPNMTGASPIRKTNFNQQVLRPTQPQSQSTQAHGQGQSPPLLNSNQMAKIQQMQQLKQSAAQQKLATLHPSGKASSHPSEANTVQDEYQTIRAALKVLNFEARNSVNHFKSFLSNNVTDRDLDYLTDGDLAAVFTQLGPRLRFRRWLTDYQNNRKKEKVMQQLFPNGSGDDEKVDPSLKEYTTVVAMFRKLQINDWQLYMQNFIDNQVTDSMLPDISEKDLAMLISKMGAKIAFRKLLLAKRQQRGGFFK